MELKTILKHTELFRGLDDQQLDQIANISKKFSHNKGVTVFEQGSVGDALYIITKGQVEVHVQPHEGESYAAIYLGEGQIFGEMALIDQGKRSATITAVEDENIIYRISTEDFTNMCTSDTAIGYVIMRNIAQDLSFKLRHQDHNV